MKTLKVSEPKFYPKWDAEKKHYFACNKYWANTEDGTIWHCNSLFYGYNCTDSDLKEIAGARIVCNTVQEIRDAFKNPPVKGSRKIFVILSPIGGMKGELKEFGYTPYLDVESEQLSLL